MAVVKEYFELFCVFVRMGCTTFGGGYAMVPVLDRELIRRKGWITMDEVMDYYTIAQVTPGIIAVNVSTFVGYKRKGLLGGFIATLGFVLPGVLLMVILALVLRRFAGYPAVRHAFAGIRVAVGALILDTVIKLVRGVFRDPRGIVICAAAFLLSVVLDFSPAALVLASGLAGFFLYRPRKANGEDDGEDDGKADGKAGDGRP